MRARVITVAKNNRIWLTDSQPVKKKSLNITKNSKTFDKKKVWIVNLKRITVSMIRLAEKIEITKNCLGFSYFTSVDKLYELCA